ncbi:hypothetical protein F5880DRAFT_1705021 [Lentinula raphanica]|nr:hypothetical protein EV360DRAFT_78161 [Lentinula raphanica]KAJ3819406.1 hypothetical protein F5880DRAFT_1705021 [Lentinula raphanica]
MTTTIPASIPQMTYSTHWKPNDSDGTMYTKQAGATANLTFTGSFIQVLGTLPANINSTIEPKSSYTLDGGSPVVFDAAKFGDHLDMSNVVFYQSDPNLLNEPHTLSIRLEEDEADFYISDIVISFSSIQEAHPSVFSILPTESANARSLASVSPSRSTSNGAGIGILIGVGAIVGGLALLVGLVAFFLVRRRRQKRNAQRLRDIRAVQPFVSEFLVPPRRTEKNGTPNFDLESVRSLSASASDFREHRQSDGSLSTSMTSQLGPPPSYTTNPRS